MFKRKIQWIGCLFLCFIFVGNSSLISQTKSLIISWDPNSEADLMGYKVYYGLSSRNYNTVIDVANQTRYTVDGLSEDISYYFAVTACDSALNESEFSEEVIGIIKSDDREKPSVVKYEIIDEALVVITFSEPVSRETAENVSNYSISENVQVKSSVLDNDQMTVHLTTSEHKPGISYTLIINNIKDRARNPNTIEANTQISYKLKSDDNTPPEIESVTLIGPTKLIVLFNEPITKGSAENTEHFKINKDIQVQNTYLDANEMIVHLITSAHSHGETYTLTIEQIKDRVGNEIESRSYSYYFAAIDTIKPEIEEILILDNEHLDVKFTEQIDKQTAEDKNNYSVSNGVEVKTALLDGNLQVVHLTTSTHQTGIRHILTINHIKDRAIPPNEIKSNTTFSYELKQIDNTAPTIIKADILSETKVNLTFSESIKRSSAENINNYEISEGISVLQAVLDENLHVVHLTTSAHSRGKTYTITVNNIVDLAEPSNFIESNSTSLYYFEIVDKTAPHIQKINVINLTRLDIYFDEPLDKSSAEDEDNYSIDKGVIILKAVLSTDLMTVELTTGKHPMDETFTLTVNHVKDNAPTPNEIMNQSYSYYQEHFDDDPPEIITVVLEDANHVHILFNEPIDRLSAETISNYQIDQGISILKVTLDESKKKVMLTTSSHERGQTYMLIVKDIKDLAAMPNYIKSNSSFAYYFEQKDNKRPHVISVLINDETSLDIMFSEQLDQESAENEQNYMIDGNIQIIKAELDNNLRLVHLLTSMHERGRSYYIYISNIKDRAEESNVIIPNTMVSYYLERIDMTRPQIDSVLIQDATKVDVYFSEKIQFSPAENPQNYQISNGIVVYRAKLGDDLRIVHLTTSEHIRGQKYRLIVNNITDRATMPNTIAANSLIDYIFEAIDKTPPKLIDAKAIDSKKMKLIFSERIDRNTAQTIENYRIDNYVEVLEVELDENESNVFLYTTRHRSGQRYTVTVNNIRDLASVPNIIQNNSSYAYSITSESILKNINMTLYEADSVKLGDRYYIDRGYSITYLPQGKDNLLWIKTANSDRDRSDDEFLSFTIEQNMKVYVAYDSRAMRVPDWLKSNFNKTNEVIRVNDRAQELVIWEKIFPAGKVRLGGNKAKGAQGAQSMYIVLVEAPKEGETFEIQNAPVPEMIRLYSNFPNPFNSETNIKFDLSNKCRVKLIVYNILGKEIKVLLDDVTDGGEHSVIWNATNKYDMPISSGLYFISMQVYAYESESENDQLKKLYHEVKKVTYLK